MHQQFIGQRVCFTPDSDTNNWRDIPADADDQTLPNIYKHADPSSHAHTYLNGDTRPGGNVPGAGRG